MSEIGASLRISCKIHREKPMISRVTDMKGEINNHIVGVPEQQNGAKGADTELKDGRKEGRTEGGKERGFTEWKTRL